MAVLRMVVVADVVEADRHDATVIGTVLVVVAFTPFDARNFRGSLTLPYPCLLYTSDAADDMAAADV